MGLFTKRAIRAFTVPMPEARIARLEAIVATQDDRNEKGYHRVIELRDEVNMYRFEVSELEKQNKRLKQTGEELNREVLVLREDLVKAQAIADATRDDLKDACEDRVNLIGSLDSSRRWHLRRDEADDNNSVRSKNLAGEHARLTRELDDAQERHLRRDKVAGDRYAEYVNLSKEHDKLKADYDVILKSYTDPSVELNYKLKIAKSDVKAHRDMVVRRDEIIKDREETIKVLEGNARSLGDARKVILRGDASVDRLRKDNRELQVKYDDMVRLAQDRFHEILTLNDALKKSHASPLHTALLKANETISDLEGDYKTLKSKADAELIAHEVDDMTFKGNWERLSKNRDYWIDEAARYKKIAGEPKLTYAQVERVWDSLTPLERTEIDCMDLRKALDRVVGVKIPPPYSPSPGTVCVSKEGVVYLGKPIIRETRDEPETPGPEAAR